MIRGRFGDTSGAPYIEGYVFLQRLSIDGLISFLVDTGSDVTVLMPVDSAKLGIIFTDLVNRTESEGIGGLAAGYEELATVSFADGNYTYSYAINIEIAEPNATNDHFPSILGRDIINRWRCTVDLAKNKVRAHPRSWDLRLKIT